MRLGEDTKTRRGRAPWPLDIIQPWRRRTTPGLRNERRQDEREEGERGATTIDVTGRVDAYGAAGREHVRKQFLLPRLVRDTLALVKSLVEPSTGEDAMQRSAR